MRIRFNLERGQYYNQWQIIDHFSIWYLEPNKNFVLEKCRLINKPSVAKRIFDGANKEVCAWIEFGSMELKRVDFLDEIKYNPRENPFWTYKGQNVDGAEFEKLCVMGRKIYVTSDAGSN